MEHGLLHFDAWIRPFHLHGHGSQSRSQVLKILLSANVIVFPREPAEVETDEEEQEVYCAAHAA
jgi:hypothetical protein